MFKGLIRLLLSFCHLAILGQESEDSCASPWISPKEALLLPELTLMAITSIPRRPSRSTTKLAPLVPKSRSQKPGPKSHRRIESIESDDCLILLKSLPLREEEVQRVE